MHRVIRIALALLLVASASAACAGEPGSPRVELSMERVPAEEVADRPHHALESGYHEISVRNVFTATGPCRELDAELTREHPVGYVLRVVAREGPEPCGEVSPYIAYRAVLEELPAGRHQLRVIHVNSEGRTSMETVLQHPILVTERSF